MGQMGFYDLANRYAGLDAKNEPLVKIDEAVPWEDFRGRLEAVWRRPDKARKSRAGRKPWDAVVMFKTIVLCALYNLSDDQVEHQIRDRLSFMSDPPPLNWSTDMFRNEEDQGWQGSATSRRRSSACCGRRRFCTARACRYGGRDPAARDQRSHIL